MKSLLPIIFLAASTMMLGGCLASDSDRRIPIWDQQQTQELSMTDQNNADSIDIVPGGAFGMLATNSELYQFSTDLLASTVIRQQASIRYKALAIDDTGKYLYAGTYDSSRMSARFELSYLKSNLEMSSATAAPSIQTVSAFASDYTQCNDGDAYNVATWDTAGSERRVLAQVHVGAPYNRLYKMDQCWRLREMATDTPFTMKTLVGHKDIGAKLLDGVGTAGAVRNPRGLAFAAGKLWFVDRTAHNILVVRSYDLSTQITTSYANVFDNSTSLGLTTSYRSINAASGLYLSEFTLDVSTLSQVRTVPFQRTTAAESVDLFLMFDRAVVLLVDANTSLAYKIWPKATGTLTYTIKDVKPVDDNNIIVLADRGSYLSWEKISFQWTITHDPTTTATTTIAPSSTLVTTTTTSTAAPATTLGSGSSATTSDIEEDFSAATSHQATTVVSSGNTATTTTTTTTVAPSADTSSTPGEDEEDADTVIINVYLGNGASHRSSSLTLIALVLCIITLVL